MLPPAPERFSTTKGTPSCACRCCCTMRASRSAEPPAANGTTIVTGRCGQSCAWTCVDAPTTRMATARKAAMPAARTPRICDLQVLRALLRRAWIKQIGCHAVRKCGSHRLEVRVPLLVEVLVGVAHGLGLGASDHHLKIDRREAVVLIAVDNAGRARNAFPGAEPRGQALAAFVLDEDVKKALQHEEAFLDLVGVCGV